MTEKKVVSTYRITHAQYQWLRAKAFEKALEQGGRPSASDIVDEIVRAARVASEAAPGR